MQSFRVRVEISQILSKRASLHAKLPMALTG